MLPGFTVEAGSQFQAAIDLDLVNAQSNAIDNVYDYSGNRIQKSYTTGLKRYYIRGVGGKTLAVLDENGAELFYNLRGLDLLGQYDVATGAKVYFLKDHLGNIRVTIDDNGNVMGYNDYYPFGLQMPRRIYNGGLANNLYKYSSKELDEESNLDWYSFGARFYDPEIARWHVTDPAGQSFSPYSYVGNSPLINVDPDGRLFGFIGNFLDKTLGSAIRYAGARIHDGFEGRFASDTNLSFGFNYGINSAGNLVDRYGVPDVLDDYTDIIDGKVTYVFENPVIVTANGGFFRRLLRLFSGPFTQIQRRLLRQYAILEKFGPVALRQYQQLNAPNFELAHKIALYGPGALHLAIIAGGTAPIWGPVVSETVGALSFEAYAGYSTAVTASGIAAQRLLTQGQSTFNQSIAAVNRGVSLGRDQYLRNKPAVDSFVTEATRVGTGIFGAPGAQLNARTPIGRRIEAVGRVIAGLFY